MRSREKKFFSKWPAIKSEGGGVRPNGLAIKRKPFFAASASAEIAIN